MSDLVERLRELPDTLVFGGSYKKTCLEAADEIERLMHECELLREKVEILEAELLFPTGTANMVRCPRCRQSFSLTRLRRENGGSLDPRPPDCSGQPVEGPTSSGSCSSDSTLERDLRRFYLYGGK